MFKKILVANRGEIALRLLRTIHRLGIDSVVVYSEADRHTPAVSQATEAYLIGGPLPGESYLNWRRILEVALETGAEAIHPGYGFLSENAEFADACDRSGIVFIGPTIHQMQKFGLKHTARALAAESQVPLLPGTELLESLEQAQQLAEGLGYPEIGRAHV